MQLFDLKNRREKVLQAADGIVKLAEKENRSLTAVEQNVLEGHMATVDHLNQQIKPIEDQNTLARLDPRALLTGGSWDGAVPPTGYGASAPTGLPGASPQVTTPTEHPRATAFRNQFAAWMNNALQMVEGGQPAMAATAPSGPVSIGTTSGWDSIGITVPVEVLPYLPSYYALDSFGLAGASQIMTDHTRPLVKPILAAGAADSTYAENAAPTASQPFGLSAFTFGGTKYARLVLASYESLMNSELPLQGAILDELLTSLATTLTQATTTQFVSAMTAPPGVSGASPMAVGVGGSGGSIYTSMIDLRHAVPPRFDLPTNKWMLSRATLAEIRNTRASTSGVPMFSPDGTMLFDRPYVINDFLDTTSGAGVGFVAFGSFADGAWIRKTPLQTRVFYELYAQNGQLGFRTQQWADSHFLAELAGAAQPPSFQPIFYTNVVSET